MKNQLANRSIVPFSPRLLVAAIAFLSVTAANAEQTNIIIENFPAGTKKVASTTADPPDVDTDDFIEANFAALRELAEEFEFEDVLDAFEAKASDEEFVALSRLSFGTSLRAAEAALSAITNADPFIAFEGTFTNTTDEPLDIGVLFTQGTIPIQIDTPLQIETFFTAEVNDTGGTAGASTDLVFVSFGQGFSDVTNPTLFNTTGSEVALNGALNLVDGVLATDSNGPNNLFVSNLDTDFLNAAGVPVEDQGTFRMSASLGIEGLSPGDTLTVRYAYSIGTEDGSIPLFPAEALVAALERDLFAIPEPSSAALLIGLGLILSGARRRRNA